MSYGTRGKECLTNDLGGEGGGDVGRGGGREKSVQRGVLVVWRGVRWRDVTYGKKCFERGYSGVTCVT